jgi:hypothetical protein
MSARIRSHCVLAGLLVAGAIVFFTATNWGLPTRGTDRYLFGSAERAWSAADIASRGGTWKPDPKRAADADPNPTAPVDRSQAVWVNATEQQQAEMARRYRLFSYQPDEMVTFMALAGMRGGSFDPRMYQYGGLWIYPVGGLLKIASKLHLITVKPDLNYYLDHPEEFGRFYIVARVYSGLWGLVGIWAIFRLATRCSDKLIVHAAAAACFLLMPIVINGTHEAKPHLAGMVLILLTALAATKYVETGERWWWVVTGALCGMAVGMVLSAAVAFLILPLMVLLRPMPWRRRSMIAVAGAGLGVLVYCITNPYVPLNLLRDPTVVRENLSALSKAKAIVGRNSDAPALQNARLLIVDGASIVGGVFGPIGILLAAVNRRWWGAHRRARSVAVLLGVPAGLVLIQFVTLAGGKTGEFGRFAVLPDVALGLVAVVSVFATRIGRRWPGPILAALVLLTGLQGFAYLSGFWADTRRGQTTRELAAGQLEELYARGARTLGVRADPAPYCLPPVDLTRWKILLLPVNGSIPEGTPAPDVIIFPVDDLAAERQVAGMAYVRSGVEPKHPWGRTRISWADKPFEIRTRRGGVEAGQP